ncbi:MAG: hypothetical protein AB7G13_28435 [Lautropia sp.]
MTIGKQPPPLRSGAEAGALLARWRDRRTNANDDEARLPAGADTCRLGAAHHATHDNTAHDNTAHDNATHGDVTQAGAGVEQGSRGPDREAAWFAECGGRQGERQ